MSASSARGTFAGDVEAAVRAAWNRALGTRATDPERSLMDMRIGAGRAVRLLDDIAAATGVVLPVTVVFQAPTCAALTDLVRGGLVPPPQPLVVLKSGDGSAPLFTVPGVGATVFELCDMGRRIGCPGTVFAIQPPGADGSPPNRCVPTQAGYVAEVMRAHLPAGPYRVMGYSYGGLVALEAARLLRDKGGRVEFIGLLDSPMPEPYWPPRARLQFLLKRFRTHAREARGRGVRDAFAYAAGHAGPLLRRLRRMGGGGLTEDISKSPFHISGLPPALGEVRDINIAAFNAYQAKFYDGTVTLFKSELGDSLSCDPTKVWPRWVRHLIVRQVPGEHETMMRGRNAGALAASITEALHDIDGA